MTIINSVSNTRFSFNGIEYFRNYISVVRGDRVEIFNCYEREDIMLSLTHYSEITLNGIIYSNAANLQSALQSVIYSRATLGADEVEVVEQNNIGRVIQLNYVTGTNLLNKVLTNINSTTTVVSATDNPVFFSAYKSASTSVVAQKLRFQFMGGKGTWGAGGKTVLPSHLYQLAPEALLPDDITANSKSNVVSLGQISSTNDFLNQVNGTTRNFSDASKLHYLSYTQDSVLYLKRFTGQHGEYDGITTVLTEDDFEEATNSNIQPGLFTPSLKDITNIDPSTDVPITIVDNNSGNKTTLTGNQIKHTSLDGNITTIDYEQNIDDVSYTIPAKNTDDVFAMQSDINGMTITANQSASELYLKNAEGTVLATINVGFLNNEGTTFFFNESTEKLELKDDLGNVLSTVPVSAFVSNLMQSVNFNGSSTYILEFKDAENNVVDSVSFGISNVEGLQTALDNKIGTSHPASGISETNITNWNNVYSASSNYATTNTVQTISGIKTFSPIINFQSGITLGSGIGSLYDSGRGYFSYTNGLFIQTNIPSYSDTMFELYISGNGYNAQLPVDSIIQGYTYSSTNNIIQASNLAKGVRFNVDVFHYGGNVCFWFNQPNTFQTFRFKLGVQTNANRTITSIANEIKPTTGITDLLTLQPVKTWNSNDFSSTNLSNWNTAFGWGDYRQFGLGSSSINNINDANNQLLAAGMYTTSTSSANVAIPGSSGSLLNLRSGVSGGAVGQIWMKSNNATGEDIYVRHSDSSSIFQPWKRLWHDGDFSQIDINNWNNSLRLNNNGTGLLQQTSSFNLNNLNTGIIYGGSDVTNIPTAGSVISLMHTGGQFGGQIHVSSTSTPALKYRNRDNGVNSSWRKLWDDNDFTSTNVANWNTAFGWGDYRQFGIGSGVQNNSIVSGDVLDFNTTGVFRVASSSTNLPIAENGYLYRIYRSASTRYILFYSDSGRVYKNVMNSSTWSGWKYFWDSNDFTSTDIANWNAYATNKADLVDGKIPASQLPSYVDDVLEYANLAAFPASGETGKLYVAINTNLVYRWAASGYIVTSSSLVLGETSATAYRGDRGKTAYDHSLTSGNPHNTQITDISGLQTALNNKANLSNTLSHKGTIPSYSELNNYNQTGLYTPQDAESNSNTPSNNKGTLQVVDTTNLTMFQTYHDDYNDFYMRVNVEGGYWRPWERMVKASERIENEDLNTPPTKAILNSLYPTARPTFTVIAPNVEKGNMYVKTSDGWRVFTGNIVY
ncbi:pyocin knob domain-containing protein [Flavobacterium alkalisoli]|uniref:pyocin knob domain-containing protein n=1 Tax=Flavobacterium alkalisoli TaxID=2602769 RepID=UPI003A93974D